MMMTRLHLAAFAWLLAAGIEAETTEDFPVVRVAQGLLRGKRVDRPPEAPVEAVYSFEGIPYARPPVGNRRFKDPEEFEPWTGIRNATSFGPNCIQKNLVTLNVSGEEDCLFLNIYTVAPPDKWATEKRPVIVYLHGGAFVQWSGDMKVVTADPLLKQGVLFVSLNYRLGVMGFLNTEDAEAAGNAGLKDQTQALRWVQENIASFGGDARRVTLMGDSAGAGAVHLHLLSPLSKGLFHRAISLSGSALAKWVLVQQPRRSALALRQRFSKGCSDLPANALVPCLQRVPAHELVFNQYDIPLHPYENYFIKTMWRPAVEALGSTPRRFLTADPEGLLRQGAFHKEVPYVTGVTSGDGILFLALGRLLPSESADAASRWAELDQHFDEAFRWELPAGLRTTQATQRLRDFYLGNRSLADALDRNDTLARFVQMCGDLNFVVGSSESARLMAGAGGRVFVYRFSRDGPIGWIKQAIGAEGLAGVVHGDDLAYLFDYLQEDSAVPRPVPEGERPLRTRQAGIVAHVANTGNPTPEGSGLLHWPAYTVDKAQFMDMDVDLSVHENILGERLAFWRSLLDARQS